MQSAATRRLFFGATLVAFTIILAMSGSSSLGQVADETPCAVAELSDLDTGDVIEDVAVAVEVPPEGTGVDGETLTASGGQELSVLHANDGTVRVSSCGAEAASGGGADPLEPPDPNNPGEEKAGSPTGCNDDQYDLNSYKWTSTFHWRYNADVRPSELGADGTEDKFKKATINITGSDNNCGMADNVGATQNLDGRTDRRMDVTNPGSTDPTCPSNSDGVNVADWGQLNQAYVGLTCTWKVQDSGANTAVESDARLNKDYNWTTSPGSGCSQRLSIEAVMTHERGHTFGLAHVSEAEHGNLTMSKNINSYCSDVESTLGQGDVLGLRARY